MSSGGGKFCWEGGSWVQGRIASGNGNHPRAHTGSMCESPSMCLIQVNPPLREVSQCPSTSFSPPGFTQLVPKRDKLGRAKALELRTVWAESPIHSCVFSQKCSDGSPSPCEADREQMSWLWPCHCCISCSPASPVQQFSSWQRNLSHSL